MYDGLMSKMAEVANFGGNIPLYWLVGYNSTDGGNKDTFVEKLDFGEQAGSYEVVMKALQDIPRISGIMTNGYWWTDSFDGDRHGQWGIRFSPSIRNKPAEEAFLRWLELYE
jgi:hypothetical protein